MIRYGAIVWKHTGIVTYSMPCIAAQRQRNITGTLTIRKNIRGYENQTALLIFVSLSVAFLRCVCVFRASDIVFELKLWPERQ